MQKIFNLVLIFIAFTLFQLAANASADDFEVQHEIIDTYQLGNHQIIDFRLIVTNKSDNDLYGVTITPTNKEFHASGQDKQIHLGYLPASGQAIVNWRANMTVAVDYFQSSMPMFFVIHAEQSNGKNVEIPVYSLGDIPL